MTIRADIAGIEERIQGIIAALTKATTREEIERIVCERLSADDRYRFAWVGERNAASERIVPRTATGLAEEYLDGVTISTDERRESSQGPVGIAARTGEIQVTADVRTESGFERYGDHVRAFGFRSVIAIPLVHERATYGYLVVYAIEKNAFGERERTAFSVLGEMTAFALDAAQDRQLLRGNTITELTFRAPAAATLLGGLLRLLDVTVRLDSVVPAGEQTLEYLSVEGTDPAAIREVLDEHREFAEATIEDWRVIEKNEAICRLELLVENSAPGALVAAGVNIRSAVAEGYQVRIVAEAPPEVEVRSVVDGLAKSHPGIRLRTKHEVERSVRSAEEFQDRLFDSLTDRQRTAIEAAYAAGYYDWPRGSTAEEVADSMDISSATLHSHLRKAQKKVLAALLDSA